MTFSVLLLAAVLPLSAPASTSSAREPRGVFPSQSASSRKASLLDGERLETSFPAMAAAAAPLRMLDGLGMNGQGGSAPFDDGGGVSADNRELLSLLLGILIGFGIGHLVAGSRDGFILFLIVDIAVIVAAILIAHLPSPFGIIATLGVIAERIIQGVDAYQHAGGRRIVEFQRESEVRIASAGNELFSPPTTSKLLALAF